MISNYEIKNINGKEVLYLYFDIDSEFGKFKDSIDNIEDKIKEFIKKNKIAFKGTTVALVVSGILVGNITLNNKVDIKPIENNNIVEVIPNEISEINKDIIIDEEVNESVNSKKEDIISENVTYNEEKQIAKTDTKISEDTKIIENIQEEKQKEEVKYVVDNNIYVTIHRKNGDILKIELEEYIIGVVGAEMPASFNIEALKAQAIVARTYALKSLYTNRTLTDTSSTQNYKDNSELHNLWGNSYNTYYNKIKNAVESTKGIYLTYNGQYIEALYHSTSNGKTEDSSNVWGNSYAYLVSVDSPYDNTNLSFNYDKYISYEELSSKLKMVVNNETEFNILNKTVGDRVAAIDINGKTYTGVEFRNLLGLRSADFEIEKNESGVTIKTKGYGHGVGMSQYGANGMAKAGYSYKDILLHYYTGVTLSYL